MQLGLGSGGGGDHSAHLLPHDGQTGSDISAPRLQALFQDRKATPFSVTVIYLLVL